MLHIAKVLYRSRKVWIGGLTVLLTAVFTTWIAPALDLAPDQVTAVVAAIVGAGLAVIGGIALEDAGAKRAGRAPPAALLLLGLAAAVLMGGCMGGHDFALKAAQGVARGVTEIETGTDEYHAAATGDFDRAEAGQRAALAETLADYVARIAADPALKGKAVTSKDAGEALAPALEKYAAQVASLAAERKNEGERYANMRSVLQWMRELAAQMADMEQRRYATTEELRERASAWIEASIARRKEIP
ncbi:MAG: hypothetical protein FJ288_13450 [Planctomycetes bacterium]|nr:hypothetical protein [Planctomycetota bacterium]